MTALGGELGVEGLSKKEKGLMDMGNSVVTVVGREVGRGGRGYKGVNGNDESTKKLCLKNIHIYKY